jgi:N-acyl-D-amino-acid deacylase
VPVTLVIRGGTVLDGTGAPGVAADVAINGDRITHVGTVPDVVDGAQVVDATGLVVAPGFINVLSHAWGSLQRDGTGASDLLQGVTTEVFGEAFSLGPSTEETVKATEYWRTDPEVRIEFDRLSQGLTFLEGKGVAQNVASFIGGHNLRALGAGFDDRPMTPAEIDMLRNLVDEEMTDGALGIGTALIYPPGNYARTDELVALSEVLGRHDGLYISHMRSEGDQFLECLDELIHIARAAGTRAEVYHLKAAGRPNFPKMATAIENIEAARAEGLGITADMYTYTAGGTALAACIPPKYHEGGPSALYARLADPAQRARMFADIAKPSDEFENLYLASGGGEGLLFFEDFGDDLAGKGRTLAQVAADMGLDEIDALLELVARHPHTGAAFFIIDEDNVRLGLRQPWVSIGSDAAAHQAIPPFTDAATHPRAYGTFARFLGRYCRDEGLFPLEEAVRRMTSLPADNLRLLDRGRLAPGGFADIVVFDPATIADHATYVDPHVYATGVHHVVVNGTPVVLDGALTHATPGRRLRRGA